MKSDDCQRYLEDPEANAGHLAECAECRTLFGESELPFEPKPLALDALPLAPWEGASHRAWPLVFAAIAISVLIAAALCMVAGISPMQIMQRGVSSMAGMRTFVTGAAEGVRNASRAAQVGFGIAVFGVNALLVVLLRKAPRGIDA
jgi:hypothetical protein